jgi:nickel transport protein
MRHASLILLCLLSPTLFAHELWLAREEGARVLYYGHFIGDHAGAERIEYPPQQVQRTLCLDAANQPVPITPRLSYPLRIEADCALSYAQMSSGYWSKTPYGTPNLPKNQAKMPIRAWQSFESVKRLDAWHPGFAQALPDSGLDLAPQDNPLDLHVGDKLHLRLSFRGQPVANAVVAYAGKPRGETSADGEIAVRLKQTGQQWIEATYREPGDGIKADEIVHTTTLLFALAGEGE